MRVLGFGTYDTAAHPRIGVLLEGLEAHGATVREVNAPLGFTTSERVRMLREPWRLRILAGRLGARWWTLAAGAARFRGTRAPDAIVVGYLGHFDVLLARALFPRGLIVLDHLIFAAGTAIDRGTRRGVRTAALSLLDRVATAAADLVVLDTPEHLQMLAPRRRADGVVVPVGAGTNWADAARPAEDTDLGRRGRLSVVFFGLFTPLQGTVTIARAIRALRDRGTPVDVTLIGDGQDAEEVRDLLAGVEGVSWVPWLGRDELPGHVAAHDVCLGILGTSPKALNVVPNKVYQGAAAGCCVVTSDTAPQRRILGDAAILVPPGDHAALAAELHALTQDPDRLIEMRRRAATLAAAAFTPRAVVEPLRRTLAARGAGEH